LGAFRLEAEALSQISISREKAEEFLISWIGDPEVTGQPKSVDRVAKLFSGQATGSELASADGTAWGLLKAVTEFVDHARIATRSGRSRRMRTSAVFGAGATLKRKAFKYLLQLRHVA
jgi:hypothetical protein